MEGKLLPHPVNGGVANHGDSAFLASEGVERSKGECPLLSKEADNQSDSPLLLSNGHGREQGPDEIKEDNFVEMDNEIIPLQDYNGVDKQENGQGLVCEPVGSVLTRGPQSSSQVRATFEQYLFLFLFSHFYHSQGREHGRRN